MLFSLERTCKDGFTLSEYIPQGWFGHQQLPSPVSLSYHLFSELDLGAQHTSYWDVRESVYEKHPHEVLEGGVEFDELYIIAGRKGHPESVKKRPQGPSAAVEGQAGPWNSPRRQSARLGMVQRKGFVIIQFLENVQWKTMEPIIRRDVRQGAKIYTDEYNIYTWLSGSYKHKTVNNGQGEYAKDEDGRRDIYLNTMEDF